MKKIILILIFVLVVIAVFLLLKRNEPSLSPPSPTQEANQALRSYAKANLITVVSNFATSAVSDATAPAATADDPMNALTSTNLEQWKTAIKGLTRLGGIQFHQDWIYEQHNPDRSANRNTGIPITLSQNGKTIAYIATFINLSTKNGSDNDLLEIELYSPNMNIEQTRALGLQICNMLGVDPKNFLAWCDQVGNRWMDQPLFGDGDGHHYSFHLLQSFNDEKPWVINFMITPNR